ncbi:hypothetical protein HOU02_gp429 [Caulobacter phage CcrBL9]|uniref:Uncharacterized protein n=1 Tax=Caulobacter phage CcrBL9 TaxID=2283270 RepID=A0A385EC89_9CAUD|nr:hypothetical protein HOU02_gp429 [Caulobacter phage CcrBL9]AXQ69296.1 hypothetical protein CcrBL9_gp272c [Caulobacter phage CcrBL9]
MGRQVTHYHLIKQKNDLGNWEGSNTPRVEYVFYCGERDTTRVTRSTEDPFQATCPACARHAGKMKIAETGADLKTEAWEPGKNKAWKSANYAVVNGEPFAHILFDTGYNGKWMIRMLAVDGDEVLVGQKPEPVLYSSVNTVAGVEKTVSRSFGTTAHSKEMALYLAYQIFLAGKLVSLTQTREAAAQAKKAHEEREARWRESRAQATKERSDLIEALEGIRTKAEAKLIDLTNFEVDSLMKAIAIVKEAHI